MLKYSPAYVPGVHSHTYNEAHFCTECETQATFTVAGSGAHMNGEWQPENTANNMTFADGVYTKVYTNVDAGSYELKCVRDHSWSVAYPGSNYAYTVETAGSTVTVTLTGTTVDVKVEAPHTHTWVDATCKTPKTCSGCGATEGEADPTAHYTTLDICLLCYLPQPSLVVGANEVVVPASGSAFGMIQITEAGMYQVTGSVGQMLCIFTDSIYAEGSDFSIAADGTLGASWYKFSLIPVELAPGYYYVGVYGEGTHTVTISEYVEPIPEGTYVLESEDLEALGASDDNAGKVLVAGNNDFFSIYLTNKSKIDSSSKTWKEDPWGDLAYQSGQRLYLGGKTGVDSAAIKFTTANPATVTVWWVSNDSTNDNAGSGARPVGILDAEGNLVVQDASVVAKNAVYVSTFELEAAGTYYLGNMVDNNYFYKVVVVENKPVHEHSFVEGECECGELDADYVNTLVVGDTNKIIVNGDTFNEYNLPIEWVAFVADEKAHYEFVGNNGALVFIFDADLNLLCLGTGKADLEAGTYLICVGNGLTGAINVAVTKTAITVPEHENKLVIGENNKIYVDGSILNQNNNPIAWVPFVVEEKALYTFASETENALVYIFNSDFSMPGGALTSAAVLEPGNYLICVGNGAVGDIYVTVTKSEVPTTCEHVYVYMNCKLCGAVNPHFAYNLMVVGTNKVVCNEYHLVDTTGHGNPYQFTTFTVTEDGHYKFSVADGKIVGFTIFTTEVSAEGADWTAGTGASWGEYIAGTEADLKAGTYYVGMIFVDGVGEYSITLELVPPHTHTWSEATCTKPAKCECGETKGEALGHDYKDGVCTRCEGADPNYVEPNFFQKIIAWFMDLIQKILGVFKK